jgi:starch phosphorylase
MISYFSMEIGLDNRFKNFAGGLGILAGDTLKSAADLGVDMVGITLNYSHGYFQQELDAIDGFQIEHPDDWDISKYLILEDKQFELELASGNIVVRIWRYEIKGFKSIVPVYFLDTDFEANTPENRSICYNLYTPDSDLRLKQEILLGMGGVKALETLGLNNITKYHLNESHAAFAILKLRRIL